jgi:CRP-like cAMP-binding protein
MYPNGSTVRTREYPKGAMLFQQGQRCRGALELVSGRVAVFTSLKIDRIQLVELGSEALLGLPESVKAGAYEVSAVAMTDVTVRFIPRVDVLKGIRQDPSSALQIVATLGDNVASLYQQIKELRLRRPYNPRPRVSHVPN